MTAYAFYDLAVAPASYDILTFLIHAKRWAAGRQEALRVVIVPGRYDGFRADQKPISVAEKHFRLNHILLPACRAIEASVTVCSDRREAEHLWHKGESFPEDYSVEVPTSLYDTGSLIALGRREGSGWHPPSFMPSPQALAWVDDALGQFFGAAVNPVVITLRETYTPARNSDLPSWIAFAKWLQKLGQPVVLIRDWEKSAIMCDPALPHFQVASLDMDVRLALYERALVNMSVGGGPPMLNAFGARRPYLLFKMQIENSAASSADYLRKIGLPKDSQFPWATANQRIIWTDDALHNLRTAYEGFCNRAMRDQQATSTFPPRSSYPTYVSSRLPILRELHAPERIERRSVEGRELGGLTVYIFLIAVKEFLHEMQAVSVLDYGCGRAMAYWMRDFPVGGQRHRSVEEYWCVEQISLYEPAYEPYAAAPEQTRDVVLAFNVLERSTEAELENVLDDIFRRAERGVFFIVAGYPSSLTLADGSNLVVTLRQADWWRDRIATAAKKRPGCKWQLFYLPEDPVPASQRGAKPKYSVFRSDGEQEQGTNDARH